MVKVLQAIGEAIDNTIKWVIVILIGTMTVVVCLEVFSRGAFQYSFYWAKELARFLQVYVAIIGSSYAVKIGAHLGIDAFTRLFSPLWRHITAIIVCLFITAFSVIIMIMGGIIYMMEFSYQTASALPIPMNAVYVSLPIAGVLNVIYCFELIATHISKIMRPSAAGE
jgi:TRAP-type C4-dicarboxylate transport system permease small subunit